MIPLRKFPQFTALLVLATLAAACADNPLRVAETLEQKAYAIERSYNVILEDALVVAKDPATNTTVRRAIQSASERATPVVDSLADAAADAAIERAKLNVGQSTLEKVNVVASNLRDWIDRAQAAMLTLRTAFRP